MIFTHDMSDYCAYCFQQLYGGEECNCEKSELESKMASEIYNTTKAIEERYKNEYGIFWDETKVQEFKNKNEKFHPSYW